MKSKNIISGKVYLLGDNIDTDQILTAEYLKVNPSTPEGYEWLGKLAMCGLPIDAKKFRDKDGTPLYSIIVAGENFGCGSSREHAVVALGAAGIKLVIAKSFARIFFRNSIVTGEVMPITCSDDRLMNIVNGTEISIDLDVGQITLNNGDFITVDPIGELSNVVKEGGLFNYARSVGKIPNISNDLIEIKNIG